MLYSNILIPTDFSLNSEQAYEFALNFAKKSSARLHLLHVIEPIKSGLQITIYPDKLNFERDRFFCAEEELERFINKYSNSEVNICRAVSAGKPYEEILKYAKDEKIDLVILSTHGKTNLDYLIAGNVTKKILRFAEVPVVCIKTGRAVILPELEVHENLAENWVG